MKPRVILTGAAGFVGTHLVEGLTEADCDVVAIDRRVDTPAAAALARVRVIEAPLADIAAADIGSVDTVIHAAALTARPDEAGLDLARHLAANIDAHLAAMALATALGARRFLFVSSAGVFAPGARRLDEDAVADAAIPYAAAKRMGEIATDALALSGIETMSLRLGNVYGPGEIARPSRPRVSLVQQMLDTAASGEPVRVETPDATRDWTFAPDIGRHVARLVRAPVLPGPLLHLVASLPVTDRTLAETIAAARPGTRIVPGAGVAAIRPPLETRSPERRAAAEWTSLATGIAATLRAPDIPVRPGRTTDGAVVRHPG